MFRRDRGFQAFIVYISLLLDNILLTVIGKTGSEYDTDCGDGYIKKCYNVLQFVNKWLKIIEEHFIFLFINLLVSNV